MQVQKPLSRIRLFLRFSCGIYAVLLILVYMTDVMGPERWWWSTLNLYLPQWLWGAPGGVLLIATGFVETRLSLVPLFCLCLVAGPMMGFCWRGYFLQSERHQTNFISVMTYNVKNGHRDVNAIATEIRKANPDILLLQDSSEKLRETLKPMLRPWHRQARDQFTIYSRFPFLNPMPRHAPPLKLPDPVRFYRCQVRIGDRTVTLISAHLRTPREGLTQLKSYDVDAIAKLKEDASLRLRQADLLAQVVRESPGPVIVGGDLNAPIQSLVCRTLFSAGLYDAFSRVGRGYGYTYGHDLRFGHSYVRIDHLLLSEHWTLSSCQPGGSQGSDHRPVLIEARLG